MDRTEKVEPSQGATDTGITPANPYYLSLCHGAKEPELHTIRADGATRKMVLAIVCPCGENKGYRLSSGRAVRCESCGVMYARVGRSIVAVKNPFDENVDKGRNGGN